MTMRVGDTVRLVRIPNHPCSALRSKHIGMTGLVIADDHRDEFERVAYTVAFPIGRVFITDDLVEVIEEAPKWQG